MQSSQRIDIYWNSTARFVTIMKNGDLLFRCSVTVKRSRVNVNTFTLPVIKIRIREHLNI